MTFAPQVLELVRRTVEADGDIDAHSCTLFSLALSLKAKRILETGVRTGRSTYALLTAAHILDGKLLSIDTTPPGWQCPEILQSHWQFTKSDACVAMVDLVHQSRKFDLIVLDDWHSSDHVASEIVMAHELLVPGGLVVIHDAMWCNTQPAYNLSQVPGEFNGGGPARAILDLDPSNWERLTIPIQNGLTLLRPLH